MSRTADARADVALLAALADGPLDVLDLLQVLRRQAAWLLRGGEGVVHVLLHRLLRQGRVRLGGRSARGLVRYAVAAPEAATADEDAAAAPDAPDAPGDPAPVDAGAADRARRVAGGVADPADRGRVQADATAHLDLLVRADKAKAFGRIATLSSLLHRVDRGRRTVAVVVDPIDFFRRLVLHDGVWLVGIVVAFFVVRAFVLEVFHIPSSSMEPTLLVKDRVVVRKIGPAPKRWDIVTFELRGITYVKRMVGMPGEAFGIRNGDLYADGRLLVKPDDLSAALRKPIARWDFGPTQGPAGPGSGWRRMVDGERVTWVRDAPPLRPDGSVVGEPSPYSFALRDGYLVVEGRLEADGALRAVLARAPFGYEGEEPGARFEAEAGTHGVRVLVRRREASGAWIAPEVLLDAPDWRVDGDVRLELAYIDGVLRLATGGRTWREAVEAPDQPLRVEVGSTGAGATLRRAALDGDQHWSHDHQYAVPRAPRPDGHLPPLATYAFPIPDDAFFALGDNTLNSDDSRTVQKGAIPLAALTGPVIFRLWPPSRVGTVK